MSRFLQEQTGTIQLQNHTIQQFIESIPSACFTFDREGIIRSWNSGAERIHGYSKTETIGTSSFDLIVTLETKEEIKKVNQSIFQGNRLIARNGMIEISKENWAGGLEIFSQFLIGATRLPTESMSLSTLLGNRMSRLNLNTRMRY